MLVWEGRRVELCWCEWEGGRVELCWCECEREGGLSCAGVSVGGREG